MVQAGALKAQGPTSPRCARVKAGQAPQEKAQRAERGYSVSLPQAGRDRVRRARDDAGGGADLAVDLFLDGATLQPPERGISIIHGKGTGVLRSGIHRPISKSHPAVKEFRLGRYGEGEDGVTIVTLKD